MTHFSETAEFLEKHLPTSEIQGLADKKILEYGYGAHLGTGVFDRESGTWQFPIRLKAQEEVDYIENAGLIVIDGAGNVKAPSSSDVIRSANTQRQSRGNVKAFFARSQK